MSSVIHDKDVSRYVLLRFVVTADFFMDLLDLLELDPVTWKAMRDQTDMTFALDGQCIWSA